MMTKTKINEFRTALVTKQAELENGSRGRDALAIEHGAEEMDRIQLASERESAIDKLERMSSRWVEVREALRRLEDGTYGICSYCEDDIHPKRLAAIPWASSCIACQESAERELMSSSSETGARFAMAG